MRTTSCLYAGSLLACSLFAPLAASAQSLSSYSTVDVGNGSTGSGLYSLSSDYNSTGAPTFAASSTAFSGQDSQGNSQVMTFTGSANASAQYGQLHSSVSATVSNPYYNASNPVYYDASTGDVNTAGSPDFLGAAGFTEFSDTLQFGGQLQDGYMARYIFHIDGVNSGVSAGAFLNAQIAGDDREYYYNTDTGNIAVNWATGDHAVNGTTPQTIDVQFAAQFNSTLSGVQEGVDYSGAANFSSTVTLTGIELVDANGNLASGWTVTSASGTHYSTIQATPAPAGLPILAGGFSSLGLLVRRRRTRK